MISDKKYFSNKRKILMTLRDFKRCSSNKISSLAGINYDVFMPISKKMIKENLIKSYPETFGTYWEITRKGLKILKEYNGKNNKKDWHR
jgi:predicted transcriptional regulator